MTRKQCVSCFTLQGNWSPAIRAYRVIWMSKSAAGSSVQTSSFKESQGRFVFTLQELNDPNVVHRLPYDELGACDVTLSMSFRGLLALLSEKVVVPTKKLLVMQQCIV